MSNAHSLYSDIEVSSEVLSASSHRLIQLLFDKSLQQMRMAELFMEKNQVLQKCVALTKAMDIVLHLRSCLNLSDKKTKELAEKIDKVYDIVEKNILAANMNNNVENLKLAYTTLANLKAGWDGIA